MTQTHKSRLRLAVVAVLLLSAVGLVWRSRAPEGAGEAARAEAGPGLGGEGSASGGASASAAVASTSMSTGSEPLPQVPCELSTLLDEYRKGKASPAYRRYVREQLRGLVESLPEEVLWSRLLDEKDPELLDVVAEAWVLRYTVSGKAAVLERLVDHLGQERNPALRATLVRALAHTGEPSTQLLGQQVLKERDVYREWAKDASPEVRRAVVENFREEAARNFGRYRGVSERAVALAVETQAQDPATAAGLLSASSIEAAGGEAVAKVRGLLQSSEHTEVRAAAARALGTSPVSELSDSMEVLAQRYTAEKDSRVRGALLEAITRLGMGSAVPVLQRLRGVDASMQAEVDGWLALLAERPQTWDLLDKARQARDSQTRN
jgi:hypothetical protein